MGQSLLEHKTERIHKYLLPPKVYEHDNGTILYAIMSPIELPFRIHQSVKNLYFHLRKIEHRHD